MGIASMCNTMYSFSTKEICRLCDDSIFKIHNYRSSASREHVNMMHVYYSNARDSNCISRHRSRRLL